MRAVSEESGPQGALPNCTDNHVPAHVTPQDLPQTSVFNRARMSPLSLVSQDLPAKPAGEYAIPKAQARIGVRSVDVQGGISYDCLRSYPFPRRVFDFAWGGEACVDEFDLR